MDTHDKPLEEVFLQSGAGFCSPDSPWVHRVTMASPAVDVMTDLRRVAAATVEPSIDVDEAQHAMVLRGVRSLLVVRDGREVLGLITANDLLGEKPLSVTRERGLSSRKEVLVQDVMVPAGRVLVMRLEDVLLASVGRVLATLRAAGRQHALVAEAGAAGQQMIRGVFSVSQIARQLGIPVQMPEVARTFAEIEAQLGA